VQSEKTSRECQCNILFSNCKGLFDCSEIEKVGAHKDIQPMETGNVNKWLYMIQSEHLIIRWKYIFQQNLQGYDPCLFSNSMKNKLLI